MVDLKAVYYASRSALSGQNPYDQAVLSRVYAESGDTLPTDPKMRFAVHNAITLCVNLPTALMLMTPWAMLSWSTVHEVWFGVEVIGLVMSAWLILEMNPENGYWLGTLLASFLVANAEIFLATGNLATVVIGASVIAVWCFEKEKVVWAGVCLLAVALVLKPHDCGLIWLYLMLRGGAIRRRALKVLVLSLVLSLVSVVWISNKSPDWPGQLKCHLAQTSARGDINDPGPRSLVDKGAGMIVSLQSVLSYFRDDPSFYSPATFLICGAMLLLWGSAMLMRGGSEQLPMLAMGVVIPISLLITYHRNYDAKILLLTIPACEQLWSERGLLGKVAAGVNGVTFLLDGDLAITAIFELEKKLRGAYGNVQSAVLKVLFDRPIAVALLMMALFYLVVYLHRIGRWAATRDSMTKPAPAA